MNYYLFSLDIAPQRKTYEVLDSGQMNGKEVAAATFWSLDRRNLDSSDFLGSFWTCLPSAGTAVTCCHTWILQGSGGGVRGELRSSCLQALYLLSISPAPLKCVLLNSYHEPGTVLGTGDRMVKAG